MKRFWLTIVFTLHALFAPFLVLNVFSEATIPYETVGQALSKDYVANACSVEIKCPSSIQKP